MQDFLSSEVRHPNLEDWCDGGHSRFQIEHFITTRGNWTPWGKLQQALREVRKRRQGETQLHDDIELALIERTEVRRTWCFRATSRRRRAVRLRQLRQRIDDLQQSLATNRRELESFEAIARNCSALIGPVTPDQRAALEAETWRIRIRAMAAIDVLSRGGISHATLELICAIPPSERESILQEIRESIEAGKDRPERSLLKWLDGTEEASASPDTQRSPCGIAADHHHDSAATIPGIDNQAPVPEPLSLFN